MDSRKSSVLLCFLARNGVKTFTTTVFVLCSFLCFAQVNEYTFIGTLIVKDARPYSFQLQFKDSAGTISGSSVTDLQGPDQTKTAIAGDINYSKKEFSFKETRLISTRSKASRDSFCYIRAKLKLKERRGTKVLSGTFMGYMKDGVSTCGKGEITLVSKDDILHKLMKLGPAADTVVRLLKQTEDTASREPEVVTTPLQSTHLSAKAGSTTALSCNSRQAILELWDNSKVDGDIIILMHNDRALLSHYTLTTKKERFTIDLTGRTERITLISEHEGLEPPTTVRLSCTCGNKVFTIDASSSIGRPVELVIQ